MTEKETKAKIPEINVEEMAQAGLHFGHKTSKVHPKMEPYLYGVRNTIHILDLDKTKEKLETALRFLWRIISEGKVLLVVGTKVQAKDLVKDFAEQCGFPYVSERWIGGTFTNFEVLRKRINYFKGLQEKKDKGELEKYTKKEQADMSQELRDFNRKFGGIKDMEKLPDAVFVLSMRKDDLAVEEAKKKNIPIIGVADTDTNPILADHPIPASDDAVSAVKYILDKARETALDALKENEKRKEKEEEERRLKEKEEEKKKEEQSVGEEQK
jgi:small subunit ribosomal protein S2